MTALARGSTKGLLPTSFLSKEIEDNNHSDHAESE